MDKKNKLKMNLQYFAENDNQESGQEAKGNQNDNTGNEEDHNEQSTLPQTQAELDAMINKANQKAIRNAKKDLYSKDDLEVKIQEALKKQKEYEELSDDQRKEKEFEDKLKAFETERAEFEKEKLVTQVKSDLIDKGLPTSIELDDGKTFNFAELFVGDKANSEEALAAVTAFETAFNQALAKELKEQIKQSTPGSSFGSTSKRESLGSKLAKNSINNQPIFKEEN